MQIGGFLKLRSGDVCAPVHGSLERYSASALQTERALLLPLSYRPLVKRCALCVTSALLSSVSTPVPSDERPPSLHADRYVRSTVGGAQIPCVVPETFVSSLYRAALLTLRRR